jgi:protein-tyrosine-phosphatase
VWNVLFLCTGNSARSILAEALLRHVGGGRFRAFSAGQPSRGRGQSLALAYLRDRGMDASGLASKGWEAFAGANAQDGLRDHRLRQRRRRDLSDLARTSVGPRTGVYPDPAQVEGTVRYQRKRLRRRCDGARGAHPSISSSCLLPTLDRSAAERAQFARSTTARANERRWASSPAWGGGAQRRVAGTLGERRPARIGPAPASASSNGG